MGTPAALAIFSSDAPTPPRENTSSAEAMSRLWLRCASARYRLTGAKTFVVPSLFQSGGDQTLGGVFLRVLERSGLFDGQIAAAVGSAERGVQPTNGENECQGDK